LIASDRSGIILLSIVGLLQAAAGIFKYLRDVVVPTIPSVVPTDLSTEALNMIENIMLAQVRRPPPPPHD